MLIGNDKDEQALPSSKTLFDLRIHRMKVCGYISPQKVFNGVQKLSDTKTRSALGYSKVLCICFVLCASASLQVATHRDCQCDKKCNGRSARQRALLELLFPVVRTSPAPVMFRSPNHCDVHAAYSIGSCPCTLRGNLPP